jgi:hypothetical protein
VTWPTAGFEPSKSVDDDVCTYWAAGKEKTAARLEVNPVGPTNFTLISILEPIKTGERTIAYHIELKENGG